MTSVTVLSAVPPWVVYLVAAVLVLVLPRRLGTVTAVGIVGATVPWVLIVPTGTTLSVSPFGFEEVLFRVDGLSRPVAALFGFVAAINVLYGYATDADARQMVYSLRYMGAGVAAVLAGDWLTLLVAWELLAVTATVLVWHHGGSAVPPAFRYAVYHLVDGTFLVAAVALHYAAAGTFLYNGGFTAGLPTALALVGVGVNLGFVGLHARLPETYPQPHAAASVVLAAFTTKVAVHPGSPRPGRERVRRLDGRRDGAVRCDTGRPPDGHKPPAVVPHLSQVGYMTVAIGIGTAAGVTGAFAHLTANILYKGLLFIIAGAIIVRTGETSLKRLGGLASAMPLTFATFLIAAPAVTGVPGFSGFVSKGLVTKAVESAGGDFLWWALVAAAGGRSYRSSSSAATRSSAERRSHDRSHPRRRCCRCRSSSPPSEPWRSSLSNDSSVVCRSSTLTAFSTRSPRGLPPGRRRRGQVVRSRAVDRLGSIVGRAPETADTALHTTIGALVATAALALVVAALA